MGSLYHQLGSALRSFIKRFDPHGDEEQMKKDVEEILEMAERIGAPLEEDAEGFKEEFARFLEEKGDPDFRERLLKMALRLEQETREI